MKSPDFRNTAPSAFAAVCLLIVLTAGCASTRPIVYESPPVVQGTDTALAPIAQNEGSLFNPNAGFVSLWQDNVAHRVGDIVMVRITANHRASQVASTELSRDSDVQASIEALLGREGALPGVIFQDPDKVNSSDPADRYNSTTPAQLIKSQSSTSFQGDGTTERTGSFVSDISAIVTHVYPNGNLRIHGSQSLLINNENTLITIDGIVRPSDLSADNMVTSNRIANAHLEITGRGVVSDKQRPGMLMRVFDWVWPF